VFAGTLSFNFAESGSTTTLTVNGSISDLSAWAFYERRQESSAVNASSALVVSAVNSAEVNVYTRPAIAPSTIGSDPTTYSGNFISGANVGFDAFINFEAWLALPTDYVAGSPINSSSSFNRSLSSLGLTSGTTYSWNYGADTISINIAAVPEPSTCAMALAGLACGGYSLFRRRRAR